MGRADEAAAGAVALTWEGAVGARGRQDAVEVMREGGTHQLGALRLGLRVTPWESVIRRDEVMCRVRL